MNAWSTPAQWVVICVYLWVIHVCVNGTVWLWACCVGGCKLTSSTHNCRTWHCLLRTTGISICSVVLVSLLLGFHSKFVLILLFLRYSQVLVENCEFFISYLCLMPPSWVMPFDFLCDVLSEETRITKTSKRSQVSVICWGPDRGWGQCNLYWQLLGPE